ncbi:MAG: polysaccharide deacetylase family protein [Oscillospiraceae bacterium]|nr:polysaccharide deacetylase family protein [Oscillospiraceae bacterium]
MKKFIKIAKIGCLSLCSVLIMFELYILITTNKITGISDFTEIPEAEEVFYEIDTPMIPMDNLIINDDEIEETAEITKNNETTEITENIENIENTKITENINKETENKIKNDSKKEPIATKAPGAETKITETTEELKETEPEIEIELETFNNIQETEKNTEDIQELHDTREPTKSVIYRPVETELISKNFPVLMYHTSSENNPGALAELYVKPSEFEKQIQYLADNGFTFCTFDDYYNLNNIDKPVFITFDDGYKANYTEIYPILQKYNAKITLFLTINNIAAEDFTVEMIREMSDSGLVKFESHTLTHPDLAIISTNETRLTNELENSKIQIEEITGNPVLAIAYPAGHYNDTVIEKSKEFYSFGLLASSGMHNTEYNLFEIRRIRMNRSTTLNSFINYLG